MGKSALNGFAGVYAANERNSYIRNSFFKSRGIVDEVTLSVLGLLGETHAADFNQISAGISKASAVFYKHIKIVDSR